MGFFTAVIYFVNTHRYKHAITLLHWIYFQNTCLKITAILILDTCISDFAFMQIVNVYCKSGLYKNNDSKGDKI